MNLQPFIDACLGDVRAQQTDSPTAVFVLGPILAGKTTFRRKMLDAAFFVHIDSADIFHALSAGDASFHFPDAFSEEIQHIGRTVTRIALERRLDVVLETPGHDAQMLTAAIDGLKSLGYTPEIRFIDGDLEECKRREETRGDNVSSYWAAPIHLRWVIDECQRLVN
jgi:AAA domain